jgi:hypothetical protein
MSQVLTAWDRIDILAIQHGRVSVREGFEDGTIRAAVPSGKEFVINELGRVVKEDRNFSIDWNE